MDELNDIIKKIEDALERLETGVGKRSDCVIVGRELNALRARYRENPEDFEGHIQTLKSLGERFKSWLSNNHSQIVDWYCEINDKLTELDVQKSFFRQHFIASAEETQAARDLYFESGENKIRVRPMYRRALPEVDSPERQELEAIVSRAGRWEKVGQLNTARLHGALKKGLFSNEDSERLERLCPTKTTYQVSVNPKDSVR